MNWKSWIPLVVALVLGLAAAKLAMDVLSRPGPGPRVELVEVVCVSSTVLEGETLAAGHLTTTRVPAEAVPAGVLRDVAAASERVARHDMLAGQLVFEGSLLPPGTVAGLQATLPPGKRALTVRIDEFSGVGGYLQPNSRVDVVSTFQGEQADDSLARTICRELRVIAVNRARGEVDDDGNERPGPATSVTLEVTAEEAEMIELASSVSSPRLVLRSGQERAGGLLNMLGFGRAGDDDATDGITLAQLIGSGKPRHDPFAEQPTLPVPEHFVAGQERPRRSVEIIRGGVSSKTAVDEPADPPAASPSTQPVELITEAPLGVIAE